MNPGIRSRRPINERAKRFHYLIFLWASHELCAVKLLHKFHAIAPGQTTAMG